MHDVEVVALGAQECGQNVAKMRALMQMGENETKMMAPQGWCSTIQHVAQNVAECNPTKMQPKYPIGIVVAFWPSFKWKCNNAPKIHPKPVFGVHVVCIVEQFNGHCKFMGDVKVSHTTWGTCGEPQHKPAKAQVEHAGGTCTGGACTGGTCTGGACGTFRWAAAPHGIS